MQAQFFTFPVKQNILLSLLFRYYQQEPIKLFRTTGLLIQNRDLIAYQNIAKLKLNNPQSLLKKSLWTKPINCILQMNQECPNMMIILMKILSHLMMIKLGYVILKNSSHALNLIVEKSLRMRRLNASSLETKFDFLRTTTGQLKNEAFERLFKIFQVF